MASSALNINFNIYYQNVRVLRSYKKSRKIFNYFSKYDGAHSICFIQEAHCDKSIEQQWQNQWRGLSFFSHGSNNSRGVMTLIGSQLEFKLLTSKIDPQGRFIILNCVIQGMEFLLINIYAPNYESEQVEFFKSIEQELSHFDPELYNIWR